MKNVINFNHPSRPQLQPKELQLQQQHPKRSDCDSCSQLWNGTCIFNSYDSAASGASCEMKDAPRRLQQISGMGEAQGTRGRGITRGRRVHSGLTESSLRSCSGCLHILHLIGGHVDGNENNKARGAANKYQEQQQQQRRQQLPPLVD